VYYSNKWRDYGIFFAYCGFNFAIVFLCSWLYLGGLKSVKDAVSPAARREKKARQVANEKA